MDKTIINVADVPNLHTKDSVYKVISDLRGVDHVKVGGDDKSFIVEYDSSRITNHEIKSAILKNGYNIIEEKAFYKEPIE